jgi:hypothetical protein
MKLRTAAILFCLTSATSGTRAQEPSRSTEPVKAGPTTGSSSVSIDDYIEGRI